MPDFAADAALDKHAYISLVTRKRDGSTVATPVWFVVDAGVLLVWTDASSGKVKRIRNEATVTVTPCDARGRVKRGASQRTGRAELLTRADGTRVHQLLNRKYGVQKRAITIGSRVRGLVRRETAESRDEAFLAIHLA